MYFCRSCPYEISSHRVKTQVQEIPCGLVAFSTSPILRMTSRLLCSLDVNRGRLRLARTWTYTSPNTHIPIFMFRSGTVVLISAIARPIALPRFRAKARPIALPRFGPSGPRPWFWRWAEASQTNTLSLSAGGSTPHPAQRRCEHVVRDRHQVPGTSIPVRRRVLCGPFVFVRSLRRLP